jgi:hypothetical protein
VRNKDIEESPPTLMSDQPLIYNSVAQGVEKAQLNGPFEPGPTTVDSPSHSTQNKDTSVGGVNCDSTNGTNLNDLSIDISSSHTKESYRPIESYNSENGQATLGTSLTTDFVSHQKSEGQTSHAVNNPYVGMKHFGSQQIDVVDNTRVAKVQGSADFGIIPLHSMEDKNNEVLRKQCTVDNKIKYDLQIDHYSLDNKIKDDLQIDHYSPIRASTQYTRSVGNQEDMFPMRVSDNQQHNKANYISSSFQHIDRYFPVIDDAVPVQTHPGVFPHLSIFDAPEHVNHNVAQTEHRASDAFGHEKRSFSDNNSQAMAGQGSESFGYLSQKTSKVAKSDPASQAFEYNSSEFFSPPKPNSAKSRNMFFQSETYESDNIPLTSTAIYGPDPDQNYRQELFNSAMSQPISVEGYNERTSMNTYRRQFANSNAVSSSGSGHVSVTGDATFTNRVLNPQTLAEPKDKSQVANHSSSGLGYEQRQFQRASGDSDMPGYSSFVATAPNSDAIQNRNNENIQRHRMQGIRQGETEYTSPYGVEYELKHFQAPNSGVDAAVTRSKSCIATVHNDETIRNQIFEHSPQHHVLNNYMDENNHFNNNRPDYVTNSQQEESGPDVDAPFKSAANSAYLGYTARERASPPVQYTTPPSDLAHTSVPMSSISGQNEQLLSLQRGTSPSVFSMQPNQDGTGRASMGHHNQQQHSAPLPSTDDGFDRYRLARGSAPIKPDKGMGTSSKNTF